MVTPPLFAWKILTHLALEKGLIRTRDWSNAGTVSASREVGGRLYGGSVLCWDLQMLSSETADIFVRSKYRETRHRRISSCDKSAGASRVCHGCGDILGCLAGLVCCPYGTGCIMFLEVSCASDEHLEVYMVGRVGASFTGGLAFREVPIWFSQWYSCWGIWIF